MNSQTIRVVARVTARPETAAELEGVLRALVLPTRREQGCISYQLLKSVSDPCDFVFVEEWQNDLMMQAHLQTPHVQEAFAKAGSLLAAGPDIRSYWLVPPANPSD